MSAGPRDLIRLASIRLRTRKLRATLSALGIAAIVTALGMPASSQASQLAKPNANGPTIAVITHDHTASAHRTTTLDEHLTSDTKARP